jgi:protein-disulfide isomerase
MIGRRPALMLFGALMLALPAQAQPKKDWNSVVSATPEGGILVGNPAAKVRLLEFASFTCSHCKTFHDEGVPALKPLIASGKLAFERRSFVRNGPDFAASLLAGCLPTQGALAMSNALFSEQTAWFEPFTKIAPADGRAVGALPPEKQPVRLAELAGLDGWAAKRGLPLDKGRACLADKAAQDKLLAIRTEAIDRYKLEGTPTFVINGATVAGAYDWAALQPKLMAALK